MTNWLSGVPATPYTFVLGDTYIYTSLHARLRFANSHLGPVRVVAHTIIFSMPSKKLLVFCDGTGQDGLIVPSKQLCLFQRSTFLTLSTWLIFATLAEDGPTELLHSLQPRSLFNDGVIRKFSSISICLGRTVSPL